MLKLLWSPCVRRPHFASNDISVFQPKLIGLFLWRSSTKIAQIVLLCLTKWSPELKIEKPLNDISSWASNPISK